jgi:ribosomal protein L19E
MKNCFKNFGFLLEFQNKLLIMYYYQLKTSGEPVCVLYENVLNKKDYIYMIFMGEEKLSLSLKNFSANIKSIFSGNTGETEQTRKEKYAFFLSKMNALEAKLRELEEVSSIGLPLSEARENLLRLKRIEEQNNRTESKLNLYIAKVRELKNSMEELKDLAAQKITVSQLKVLDEKVRYLEELSDEIQKSKTKEVLIQLIEILEKLDKRVIELEKKAGELVTRDSSFVLSENSRYSDFSEPKYVASSRETSSKSKSFFDRLFGR